MTRLALATLLLIARAAGAADDPTRIFPDGEKSADARFVKPIDFNGYFPFAVPDSRVAWEARAAQLRRQIQVANGLWPMPAKTPLKPVIHSTIKRDGYTVEKVYFASLPGHYVCGNLYRPTAKADSYPGVLCPHGHWKGGRFYHATDAELKRDLHAKAEDTENGARYPWQARCAQLARMGCVVFHYDMIGYADATALTHRVGFTDADAELQLHSFLGLQTWNSIRALDFIAALPGVDAKRLACTGESGGATQTLMLAALDDRLAAAFPAVMVSTAMQGGCVCENCSLLRVGSGNVEIAALFAPKPLAMSGANDWTIDIETKGLPELKKVYDFYQKPENVAAKCFPQFMHNYNQRAREMMYAWFNKHLFGKDEAVHEQPFESIEPKDLSVFGADHPRPADELDAPALRRLMKESHERQMKELRSGDDHSRRLHAEIIRSGWLAAIGGPRPDPKQVEAKPVGEQVALCNAVGRRMLISRKGAGEQVPAFVIIPAQANGTVVVWVDPRGKASLFEKGVLVPAAQAILDGQSSILAIDAFQSGEAVGPKMAVNEKYAGFTYGYNRTLFAQRVRDIQSAIAYARMLPSTKRVELVGWGQAGVWSLAASALSGDSLERAAVDVDQFQFADIRDAGDEMMSPGAVKYGDVTGLIEVSPVKLLTHNNKATKKMAATDVVKWLLAD